jgi:hypothetical protein
MGIVYLCESTSPKGIVKFGISEDIKHLKERFREHSVDGYRTLQFKPFFAVETGENYKRIETVIKALLFDKLISQNKSGDTEITIFNKDKLKELLLLFAKEVVVDFESNLPKLQSIEDYLNNETQETAKKDDEAEELSGSLDSSKQSRIHIKRSEIGIEPGKELYFKDDENKIAINVNDINVLYEGSLYTISALTKILRNNPHEVSGNKFWLFNGKLLDDLMEVKRVERRKSNQ